MKVLPVVKPVYKPVWPVTISRLEDITLSWTNHKFITSGTTCRNGIFVLPNDANFVECVTSLSVEGSETEVWCIFLLDILRHWVILQGHINMLIIIKLSNQFNKPVKHDLWRHTHPKRKIHWHIWLQLGQALHKLHITSGILCIPLHGYWRSLGYSTRWKRFSYWRTHHTRLLPRPWKKKRKRALCFISHH